MNILELKDLAVHFKSRAGTVHAVEGVMICGWKRENSSVSRGSPAAENPQQRSRSQSFCRQTQRSSGEKSYITGENLANKSEKEMEEIRWKQISVIFQGAMNALNPLKTVGQQIVEPILLHERHTSKAEARERAMELLEQVGIAKNRFLQLSS